ncbi:MAG: AI-2E family transporter [Clostridium sp.]|nr:AI-2E family transporter [Clostridium sp.]MCI7441613.1 AI-2E family transporter [Clostridium sp.]MDY4077207.1 AI-2E family transporter [Clostridium sp.]
MKFIRDEKTKNYFLLITYAIVLAYVFLNLDTVWNVVVTIIDLIKPFIIGICIAFVLNIPMKFFEEKVVGKLTKEKSKLKRPLSLIITIIVLVGLIIGLMTFVIPQLAESCSTLVKNVPEYVDSLEKFMNKNINSKELLSSDVIEEVYNKILSMGQNIIKIIGQVAGTIVSHALDITMGVTSTIINIVMAFIVSIYILLSKEKLSNQIKKILYAYMKKENVIKFLKVSKIANIKFTNFVRSQVIEACILGVLCFIGMTICSMPYALLISTIIGVTALVPIFGAFVGAILSAFIVLMVSPIKVILFAIIFVVIQQIEGNLIYPFVVGNSIGLSALWVLFAITVGGNAFGVVGMLIGVPLFGVLYTLISITTNKRLEKRNINIEEIEKEIEDEVEEEIKDNSDKDAEENNEKQEKKKDKKEEK